MTKNTIDLRIVKDLEEKIATVSATSTYWGKSGQITPSGTTSFSTLFCSVGKVLKPDTNPTSNDSLCPVYFYNVYKFQEKNYANLILAGFVTPSSSKFISKSNLCKALSSNSLYSKNPYSFNVSLLSSYLEDYVTGGTLTLEVDPVSTTQTTVSHFNFSRRTPFKNETFKHGVSTEMVPVSLMASKALTLGSLTSSGTSSFYVKCDVDTSMGETRLFSNASFLDKNYDINLSVKSGKFTGYIRPRFITYESHPDSILFNSDNTIIAAQHFNPSGDLDKIRTYTWTQTAINETHPTNRWEVLRVSDSKHFWTDAEPKDSPEYVSEGCQIFDNQWKGGHVCNATENAFRYVYVSSQPVRGTAIYTAQNIITCVDTSDQTVFTVTFKLHTPIKTEIECFNSSHSSNNDFSVTLIEAQNQGESLPEFFTKYEDDITSFELDTFEDGTYLVLASNLENPS